MAGQYGPAILHGQEILTDIVAHAPPGSALERALVDVLFSEAIPYDSDPNTFAAQLEAAGVNIRTPADLPAEVASDPDRLAAHAASEATDLIRNGVGDVEAIAQAGAEAGSEPEAVSWWDEHRETRLAARDAFEGTLLLANALLRASGSDDAAAVAAIGRTALAIHDTIDRFQPMLSSAGAVATLGWIGLTTNVAALAITLITTAGPNADQMILEELQLIRQQIEDLHETVIRQGQLLNIRLDDIAQRMDRSFAAVLAGVGDLQRMSAQVEGELRGLSYDLRRLDWQVQGWFGELARVIFANPTRCIDLAGFPSGNPQVVANGFIECSESYATYLGDVVGTGLTARTSPNDEAFRPAIASEGYWRMADALGFGDPSTAVPEFAFEQPRTGDLVGRADTTLVGLGQRINLLASIAAIHGADVIPEGSLPNPAEFEAALAEFVLVLQAFEPYRPIAGHRWRAGERRIQRSYGDLDGPAQCRAVVAFLSGHRPRR